MSVCPKILCDGQRSMLVHDGSEIIMKCGFGNSRGIVSSLGESKRVRIRLSIDSSVRFDLVFYPQAASSNHTALFLVPQQNGVDVQAYVDDSSHS